MFELQFLNYDVYNIYFENSSITIFSFKLMLLNSFFLVNKLKIMRPIDKTLSSLSLMSPLICPSLIFFFFLFLSLNKIIFFYHTVNKKKYTHKYTYQTNNYIFLHFKIYCLINVPNTYFAL